MRHALGLAISFCVTLLVGQTAFGNSFQADIVTGGSAGAPFVDHPIPLDDNFQQGKFSFATGYGIGWPASAPEFVSVPSNPIWFGLSIQLRPAGSPLPQIFESGALFSDNPPSIYITGTLEGTLRKVSSTNLSADLHATNLTFFTQNLTNLGVPQSLIDTFTDASRIDIRGHSADGRLNQLYLDITISPQAVPEPASWFLFAVVGVAVARPLSRPTRSRRNRIAPVGHRPTLDPS